MKLPDLNVWLAALWEGHEAHPKARDWFDAQVKPLVLCRVTQMGLLRLLSNPSILGRDALDRRAAWQTLDTLGNDPRVTFLPEPDGLEKFWIHFSKRPDRAHKLWTDDYLAAFAFVGVSTLVTFDQALATRHPSVEVELLVA